MIIVGNKITPADGYKYVTNGEVYSELVFLGKNDSVDNWSDTNDEPPAPGEEITPEEALEIITGGESA